MEVPIDENQQQLANSIGSHVGELPQNSLTSEPEVILSQCISFDDMIEYTQEHTPDYNLVDQSVEIAKNVCQNCVQQNVELQKLKATVSKIQKKCAQKAAEIKRLRAAEKRSKFAKKTLEEMLCELKENNWISDEGREALKVK